MAADAPVFFFDENLPPALAEALTVLGEQAIHVRDRYPPRTTDPQWLKDVGEAGWFVISRDVAILRRPQERAVLAAYNVGVFYILPGRQSPTRCQIIQTVIRWWPEIKRVAARETRPFQYQITVRGGVQRLR